MLAAFLEVFPDAPTLGLVEPAVGPTWGDLVPLRQWLASRNNAVRNYGQYAHDFYGEPPDSAASANGLHTAPLKRS